MTKYDGYNDQCRYSPADDPKLPSRPKQGDDGPKRVMPGLKDNSNTQKAAPPSKIAKPDWTPGRGTRSTGKSAQNID